jgi:hypothetical protein
MDTHTFQNTLGDMVRFQFTDEKYSFFKILVSSLNEHEVWFLQENCIYNLTIYQDIHPPLKFNWCSTIPVLNYDIPYISHICSSLMEYIAIL